jgi:hypothetical protein
VIGRGITAGIRGKPVRPLILGAAFGRVGGLRWSALDADLEVALGSHAGIVAAARYAWRSGPDAQRIAFWPKSVGLRLKM